MREKVKSFWNLWQKKPEKMLVRFYLLTLAVMVLLHLLMGAGQFIAYQVGLYEKRALQIRDFEPVGVEIVDDETVITQTDDSQLIFNGNVKTIKIKCEFLQNPGEFVSFYNKTADGAFGIQKMMYAKIKNGYYVFDYPFGTRQVRIDLGVVPSVMIKVSDIQLNDQSAAQMMGYSNGELFYLFTVPLVLFLTLDTLGKVYCEATQKRKIKKQK